MVRKLKLRVFRVATIIIFLCEALPPYARKALFRQRNMLAAPAPAPDGSCIFWRAWGWGLLLHWQSWQHAVSGLASEYINPAWSFLPCYVHTTEVASYPYTLVISIPRIYIMMQVAIIWWITRSSPWYMVYKCNPRPVSYAWLNYIRWSWQKRDHSLAHCKNRRVIV